MFQLSVIKYYLIERSPRCW